MRGATIAFFQHCMPPSVKPFPLSSIKEVSGMPLQHLDRYALPTVAHPAHEALTPKPSSGIYQCAGDGGFRYFLVDHDCVRGDIKTTLSPAASVSKR